MSITGSILRRVRIFNGLNETELEQVSKLLKHCSFRKEDYILRDETIGDVFYLLIEGSVRITKELVKGIDNSGAGEKVIASLDASILPTFGENGILGHAPRTANVIAQSDCTLYSLCKHDFDCLASENVHAAFVITMNIAQVLSDRLQSTDENLVKLATALYIAVQQ